MKTETIRGEVVSRAIVAGIGAYILQVNTGKNKIPVRIIGKHAKDFNVGDNVNISGRNGLVFHATRIEKVNERQYDPMARLGAAVLESRNF